jgi:CheY-like chemotaxis protein
MALGALIGAYQEDDAGGLRALLPLAGQTLIEYQARCLAALGAAPVLVMVERVPVALNDAFDRLRGEGISVVVVSDGVEAASRFDAGSDVILLADGIAPDISDVERLGDLDQLSGTGSGDADGTILTVTDDEAHAGFERIDATHRWAGLARLPAGLVGATAAMIGDWDFQSTLLRRAVQAGARLSPAAAGEGAGPVLATSDAMAGYERRLLLASRGARSDWVSRFVLPLVEELATERLMETRLRPEWLMRGALVLTLGAALALTRGWLWQGLVALLLATPLDLVARRIALLRLRPLRATSIVQRMLWPAAGLALIALGWFEARHGGGWGAAVAALAAAAFAEAMRIERRSTQPPGGTWLFSRRAAIWSAIPFALGGWWNVYLAVLALYAAVSFFLAQHVHHRVARD